MIRASIAFPEPLHQRLLLASKSMDMPISKIVQEAVDTALTEKEKQRIAHSYKTFDRMIGTYTDEDPHLSIANPK
jgi:predicted DNA-binding protein